MLTIVEYGKDVYDFPALVVLGCFDAIHLGHRELLKKAKLQAKINGLDLGVMMFKDGKNGKLVYSFEERVAILEQFNVKFVLAIDYDDAFKAIAPLDFLHEVEDKINVKAYMSGKDFRFGAGAKGKSSTLKNYAEDDENGVWYMPIKDVVSGSDKISTTLVKSLLEEGNVAKANELLGSEFSLVGEVVKADGNTVNIVYPQWKHQIKCGVYSVKCVIDEVEYQGTATFGGAVVEAVLEGYSGDLSGRTLTIRFVDLVSGAEQTDVVQELPEQPSVDLQSEEETVVADATETVEEVVEQEEITEQPVEEQPVVEVTAVEEELPVEELEPLPVENFDDYPDDVEVEDITEEELFGGFERQVEQEEPAAEEVSAEEEPVIDEEPVVEELPVEEETATEEEPAVEETSVEEAVVAEEPTIEEEPVAEELPVEEEPVTEEEPAIEETAIDEEPVAEVSAIEEETEDVITDDLEMDDEFSEEFAEEEFSEEVAEEELTVVEEQVSEEEAITEEQSVEEPAGEIAYDEYSEGEEQQSESDDDNPADDEEGKID